MGLEVTEAVDGVEGVTASKERRYDIIFMDCIMPEIDGYEATTRIRADESNPNYSTPIIALTATAFDEDKAKCKEVGMNDFIEKPIRPPQISLTIEKWIKSKESEDPEPPAINIAELLDMFDGDSEIADTILNNFKETVCEAIVKLKEALEDGTSAEQTRHHAHSIKGSAANCFAPVLADIAAKIESASRDEDIDTARSHIPALDREIGRVILELDSR